MSTTEQLAAQSEPRSMRWLSHQMLTLGARCTGCVLADRLSADPNITVAVIEGGPSDHDIPQVLQLADWLSLLGGEYDYQYPTTEQPRGNSHILHSRAKVLGELPTIRDCRTELTLRTFLEGGCSSHNTLICFRPFPEDCDDCKYRLLLTQLFPSLSKLTRRPKLTHLLRSLRRGQGWRQRLGLRVDAALRRPHQMQDCSSTHKRPQPHHGRLDLVSFRCPTFAGGEIGAKNGVA